jgi:hypothetical protein
VYQPRTVQPRQPGFRDSRSTSTTCPTGAPRRRQLAAARVRPQASSAHRAQSLTRTPPIFTRLVGWASTVALRGHGKPAGETARSRSPVIEAGRHKALPPLVRGTARRGGPEAIRAERTLLPELSSQTSGRHLVSEPSWSPGVVSRQSHSGDKRISARRSLNGFGLDRPQSWPAPPSDDPSPVTIAWGQRPDPRKVLIPNLCPRRLIARGGRNTVAGRGNGRVGPTANRRSLSNALRIRQSPPTFCRRVPPGSPDTATDRFGQPTRSVGTEL